VSEASQSFDCFGGRCSVRAGTDPAAVAEARARMTAWHFQFSRFVAASELSRLNADPRPVVPVSRLMARLVSAALTAHRESGGLVDATLLDEIETAGYAESLSDELPLSDALARAAARHPARPRDPSPLRDLSVDQATHAVRRPPGLKLDSGGIAKGLFADLLGESLASHTSFAVDCAGDLRVGGTEGIARPVQVASPFDGEILHTFELPSGGVATSGIGRRSWLAGDGAPAHHLLDPSTGRPAFTGVVQATALAPTALEAEVRAKAALLSGPEHGGRWLENGGLLVLDDGGVRVTEPPRAARPLAA
jgi:thiamine biosynthesis lipoprotein